MSMQLAVLGSGSTGNSTLLVLDDGPGGRPRHLLIDAGLSPRETKRRLAAFGVGLDDLDAIVITHADHDHYRTTWMRACVRHGIQLHLHERHGRRVFAHERLNGSVEMFRREFSIGSATFEPHRLAHDSLGSIGYVVEHHGVRLGFATDLGRVPESLIDAFIDLDMLAIESNYDRQMQIDSGRPAFLKRRIMGGAGHLSNDQSLDAVEAIADRSRLEHIVLLHLSQQCNDPGLIEALYRKRAGDLLPHVTITDHRVATPLLRLNGRRAPRRSVQKAPGPREACLFDMA